MEKGSAAGMHEQTAKQYDFERFQPKTAAPSVRVVKGKRKKNRYAAGMQWVMQIGVVAVCIATVCSLLCSQAQVTELTGDIQAAQKELEAAKSTYTYLSGVMDEKSSLNNLESQAQALGLMKMERDQLTYVTLETESRIELPQTNAQKMLDSVNEKLMDILGW